MFLTGNMTLPSIQLVLKIAFSFPNKAWQRYNKDQFSQTNPVWRKFAMQDQFLYRLQTNCAEVKGKSTTRTCTSVFSFLPHFCLNLLKPTGHVMHQQV